MTELNEVERAKRKVLAVYPDAVAFYDEGWCVRRPVDIGKFVEMQRIIDEGYEYFGSEAAAWIDAASRLPKGEEEPAKVIDWGVDPYAPMEAVMHACGLLDVIKQEWGDQWTEHDQKVRAGLSAMLVAPSPIPSATGHTFEVWWLSFVSTGENLPETTQEIAEAAWNAAKGVSQ